MNTFKDERPFLGQDPYVIMHDGKWFLVESVDEKRIVISQSDTLDSIQRNNTVVVWDHPSELQVWAPELHHFNNLWYIFYAASDGDNATHRNYVLESVAPLGPYFYLGPVGPDIWGIDLTTFRYNGTRYALWSGWVNNGDEFPQDLFMAEMKSPTELGPRVRFATASMDWEKSIAPIMEGPQVANIRGNLHILYSANASWTIDYATGIMSFVGSDPLNPRHWTRGTTPLLTNAGHGMIAGSRFIYHRKMSKAPGWHDREIAVMRVEELGI